MQAEKAVITALFRDAASTERAYEATLARGYTSDDINLLMSEETRQRAFTGGRVHSALAHKARQSTEHSTPDKPGVLDAGDTGGPIGGTVGTIAPAAAAVGTALLLPGLIFAGPIAVALAAAGAVGLAGGVIGALTHWGIPKTRVEEYESQIRAGGVLMGVKPKSTDDAAWLRQEWSAAGGTLIVDS
ncbi:hypothetical protein [Povalibacter sp.]|uniref:hypothetical protein n=1 Tax=Povalibacter sp. TaxID=1962978 RepID=UPI002F40A587